MTPDISPDGTQVVFRSWRKEEGIWSVSASGGEAKLLAPEGYRPRFSPDGKWISFVAVGEDKTAHIFTIPANGGVAERLDYGTEEAGCSVWSPDGAEIVFNARGASGEFDFWRAKARGTRGAAARPLGIPAALRAQNLPGIYSDADCPQDWVDSRLLFVTRQRETTSLFQVSLGSLGRLGQIRMVPSAPGAEGVRAIRDHRGQMSILFAIKRSQTNIWGTNLTGSAPLEQLTHDGSLTSGAKGTWPALSSDGNVLAFITERAGSPDICVKDLRNASEQLLSAAPFVQSPLILDRNGSHVVFVREEGSGTSVILRNVAEKTERVLTKDCPVLHDWSRDGEFLLCADGSNLFEFQISKPGERLPLLHLLRGPMWARFSPDGRWVSFVTEAGQGDLTTGFIAPLDGSNRKIQIWQESYGLSLHWAPNGDAIYYWSMRDGFRCLYAQALDAKTKVPQGDPVAVLHRHGSQRYPWSGGTLAVGSGRMVITLKDELASVWKADLPN
jgi:Tol biopolymer transport system component